MPKNVMKLLKPSPHRQRNDFDLSHRHVFDLNFGELLPATCIETVPGDNITLHASDLLRAIPFVSSPFLRAKQHIDVWFVPYHDLWHQFDAFITQKREPVSSAFKAASYCPHVKQYNLWNAINTYDSLYPDIVGRDLSKRSYYLLQLLGYGDIENHHGTNTAGTISSYAVNPFRLAAYNYIWYNEYRQQYYDDGTRILDTSAGYSAAYLFNFDDLGCDSQANAELDGSSNAKLRRLAAMSQMRYRCWKKDLFTGVLPSTQFGVVSTVTFDAGTISGLSASFVGTQATISPGVSIGNYKLTGAGVHNQSGVVADVPTGDDRARWRSDAALSGFEAGYDSIGLNEYGINNASPVINDHANPGTFAGSGDVYHTHKISDHRHSIDPVLYTPQGTVSLSSSSGSLSGNFDILSLRKAEAVQIWRENALRAGNHIKDNMMAHYGVASDFNDHRPTYLGSVSAPLNIGDIAATANSSTGINTTVGDIAGKGISSLDEKVFKYHAKDFGVIMAVMSVLPEAEYDANGIERTNQLLEAEDFFMPEYENIGLEAVGMINIAGGYRGVPSENDVLGYAPRYFGYKTKLDKVFGNFVGNGIFRSWVSQRSDVSYYYNQETVPSIPLQFMYVNPALFDANFNVGVDVSPQFLCDVYFDVDAVRPMTVVGLPFS